MRRLRDPSLLVFLAIIVLIVAWIGSGVVMRAPPTATAPQDPPPPTVAASWSQAEAIERRLTLYGQIEPAQIVIVRARTAGLVEAIAAQPGATVDRGDTLAQLTLDDREARLRRAQAQLATAERDFTAAAQLAERGAMSRADAAAAEAQFEAARAELEAVELEIQNTTLRAPIDGVVNRVLADTGSYVAVGGEVMEIVDNDPLIAVVQVPQFAVGRLTMDGPAWVSFIGREPREGRIRFVAPLAEAATRTFRVEIELDNPQRDLPAGLSAEVVIPTEEVMAHKLSPALATLNEAGQVGVQAVGADSRIIFFPVTIVRAEADGVWVTGLPDRAHLVTVSQGLLSEGQEVTVREAPASFALTGPPGVDEIGGMEEIPVEDLAEERTAIGDAVEPGAATEGVAPPAEEMIEPTPGGGDAGGGAEGAAGTAAP